MKFQNGFTLIEVLVALTLMALLITAIFGGFRAGVSSWRAAENHVERVEDIRQLSSLLYRHLSHVIPVVSKDSNFMPEIVFTGSRNRLRYVAPLAFSVGEVPHFIEVISGLEGYPGTWIRFIPFQNNIAAQEALDSVSFISISEDLKVEFLYHIFNEEKWVEEIKSGQKPDLISIRIHREGVAWPELVLPVLMSAEL